MIGIQTGDQARRLQIAMLQQQLDASLNAYAATRSQASLVTALRIEAQIADLLLSMTGMQTPASISQLNRIGGLV